MYSIYTDFCFSFILYSVLIIIISPNHAIIMTLRKTTSNSFPLSASVEKIRRNSGGSGTDNQKSDYSKSLESDNDGKGKKQKKKLSNDEIREKLDKNSLLLEGFYNTCETIVKQNNNLNKRMKVLEDHLNIQNNKEDASLVSGEDDTCSINNLMRLITG